MTDGALTDKEIQEAHQGFLYLINGYEKIVVVCSIKNDMGNL